MNQPTREEFNRLEAEQKQLKEEVRQLREQITEPIRVVLASEDVLNQLKTIAQTQADHGERFDSLKFELKQELETHSKTWLNALQGNYTEHQSDIQTLQGTQNERFDGVDRKLDQILQLLQGKSEEKP
jgi:hypothetical protein